MGIRMKAARERAHLTQHQLAAQHRFEFTADELAAVGADVESELAEFELEMVAGGFDGPTLITPRVGMSAARTVPPEPEPGSDEGLPC